MVDGLLQHAIDHADGIVENRSARGQRAPAAGLEARRALGRGLAREHVGKRARVAAEIVDREVAPVQHRTQRRRLVVDRHQHGGRIGAYVGRRQSEEAGRAIRALRGDDRGADRALTQNAPKRLCIDGLR